MLEHLSEEGHSSAPGATSQWMDVSCTSAKLQRPPLTMENPLVLPGSWPFMTVLSYIA